MTDLQKNKIINLLCWSGICTGIILYITEYLNNRSFWRDEARIVLNIMERGFLDLIKPLSYEQIAPFGFLFIEKICSLIFGTSEYSFRLFPLICGIFSIFLFYAVARKILSSFGIPLAVWIFSISVPLSYYSSETKPYICDVVITVLLLITALNLQNLNVKNWFLLTLEGILSIWFSYSAFFILASIGIYFLFPPKINGKTIQFLMIYSFWFLSFVLFFHLSFHALQKGIIVGRFWEDKVILNKFLSEGWLYKALPGYFNFMSFDIISWVLFLIGAASLYKKNYKTFLVLFLPFFFLLIGSTFKFYPPSNRTLLFTAPLIIIFIAEALEKIGRICWKNFPIVSILLIVFFLYKPVSIAHLSLMHPPSREEIKPIMRYLRSHFKVGDVIYLNSHLQFAFKYYAKSYGFYDDFTFVDPSNTEALRSGLFYKYKDYSLFLDPYIEGRHEKEKCYHLFDKVKGNKRVWILFSTYVYQPVCDFASIYRHLDTIGIKLNSFNAPGIKLTLYDLSKGG